ncbi:hypothetical protein [Dactylosporangium sp. NPDC049140]|uniref:hypothetical protein n=1 Tax=Dactylosporangium sp. NPDC049140 TaxID=3155647 RepID=UPI0034021BB1
MSVSGTGPRCRSGRYATASSAALLLALVVGAVAWFWAGRVAGQLAGLTGALARVAERDLATTVPARQRAVETSREAASRLNANAATLTALVSRFRL